MEDEIKSSDDEIFAQEYLFIDPNLKSEWKGLQGEARKEFYRTFAVEIRSLLSGNKLYTNPLAYDSEINGESVCIHLKFIKNSPNPFYFLLHEIEKLK